MVMRASAIETSFYIRRAQCKWTKMSTGAAKRLGWCSALRALA